MTADKKAAEEKQTRLIDILKSDAPPQEKAIACKQLAVYGDKDAVPALAALLPDEQLSSWARIALEAIPDPAADEALREAIGKVQGRLLVGVINSLGVRRDAKAVDGLIARLKDADAEVASAAAVALGRIGGAAAAKALEQSLAAAPPAVARRGRRGLHPLRGKAPGGGDKPAEAVKLYDAVRKADVPKPRVLQATRGAILARGAAGIPLLVEQLQSADKALFALGLGVAREIPGGQVTDVLLAELPRATPQRQALLVLALADRNEPKADGRGAESGQERCGGGPHRGDPRHGTLRQRLLPARAAGGRDGLPRGTGRDGPGGLGGLARQGSRRRSGRPLAESGGQGPAGLDPACRAAAYRGDEPAAC